MIALLRVVRLLSMVVWVGGLCFFAFVVAPVAFHVLPSKHEAGLVVAGTLGVLHGMADVCAIVFILATLGLRREIAPRGQRLPVAQISMVALMLAATGYLQKSVVPAMERDRVSAGGDVDAAADNPARMDFERLHGLSEKIEGAALFIGLGVMVTMGCEGISAPDPH